MNGLFRFLCAALFVAICFHASGQQKHALIVAIGNYDLEKTGWGPLSSANDIPYIKSALEKQSFPSANISLIQDSAATKKGIEDAFKQLLEKVQPKDIVVIHFSSHGVQLFDDNDDETDGKDEGIVPFGAIYPKDISQLNEYVDGYLRDDDFGRFIEALRSKVGSEGNVIVFLDACNSGTATRGNTKLRGGKPALVPQGFKNTNSNKKPTSSDFMENGADGPGKAPYIVFSASRAEEPNNEMNLDNQKFMGSLTYAVSKALNNLQPGTSYRSFFAQVLSTMNEVVPSQNPVVEGTNLDQGLFAGNMVFQKPYVEISELNADGKTLIIKAGKIEGLDVGTKIALHKSGTNEPTSSTLIAKGTVTASESFTSTVVLDTTDVIAKEADAWVFVTEPVFASEPLVVEIVKSQAGGGFSNEQLATLQTALAAIPVVKQTGNAELLITHGKEKDSIIIAGNGLLFGTFTSNVMLQDQIKQYVQYKFLKTLEIRDPAFDVEVRLLPIKNGKPDTAWNNAKMVGGILEFQEKDSFVVYVKNNTNYGLYINILDLQPDGLINPVFPNTKYAPRIEKSELKIDGGKERIFSRWNLEQGPPFGMETYKIFISRQEIDMEGIARSSGARSRGNFSVLQELVNESYTATSRGSHIVKSAEPDGAVFSIVYRIKPKE